MLLSLMSDQESDDDQRRDKLLLRLLKMLPNRVPNSPRRCAARKGNLLGFV
jgi:hypothetical protein